MVLVELQERSSGDLQPLLSGRHRQEKVLFVYRHKPSAHTYGRVVVLCPRRKFKSITPSQHGCKHPASLFEGPF